MNGEEAGGSRPASEDATLKFWMKKGRTIRTVDIPSLLLIAALSLACIHAPRDYPGKLSSRIQEYLVFKAGGEIHLVMNQRIQSDRPLPDVLAWVVPLPTVPTAYFQEKDSLFET